MCMSNARHHGEAVQHNAVDSARVVRRLRTTNKVCNPNVSLRVPIFALMRHTLLCTQVWRSCSTSPAQGRTAAGSHKAWQPVRSLSCH
jgi:hypothetical protein